MIVTTCTITIYEKNGHETHPIDGPKLTVSSERPITDRVRLKLDSATITVDRRDLEKALAATRAGS